MSSVKEAVISGQEHMSLASLSSMPLSFFLSPERACGKKVVVGYCDENS